MTSTYSINGRKGRSRWSAPIAGLLAAGLLGCGGLLDVSNPNNIKGDDILLPAAGTALANGVLSRVASGIDQAALPYHVASDEMAWIGSRDGFRELDQGKLSNAFNEFSDGFFPALAQARWLADEAIAILEEEQTAATIVNVLDLARVYLYAAMAYVTIGNIYDDYVFSDRATAGQPIGPANMGSLYVTAIDYLTRGLAIASGRDANLTRELTAMRARANFDRAVWDLVGNTPVSTGMVNSASSFVTAAVADANAVLGMSGTTAAWKYEFTFSSGTSGTGGNTHGLWLNTRQENRLGGTYVQLHPTNPTWNDVTVLLDPIDNVPAPFVHATQRAFKAASQFVPITMLSTREMHLILAEAALAGGNTGGFATAINNLRAIDGLTAWNQGAPQVPALTLLMHSRQSNLFLQARRLSDQYRFDVASPEWQAGSQALTSPGRFFPITAIECLANPNIGAGNCST
jgi:hypothetical protein